MATAKQVCVLNRSIAIEGAWHKDEDTTPVMYEGVDLKKLKFAHRVNKQGELDKYVQDVSVRGLLENDVKGTARNYGWKAK